MMNQTKKHTTSKKLLALLLALIMTVSLLPMSVFAADANAGYTLNENSRFFVVSEKDPTGTELGQFVQLIDSEFAAKKLSGSAVLPLVYGVESGAQDGDILVKVDSSLGEQSYQIVVTAAQITVTGGDAAGVFYGLTELLQMFEKNTTLAAQKVENSPLVAERSVYIDCGRVYYSPDLLKALIKTMAWNKMNTLYLDFSNNNATRFFLNSMTVTVDGTSTAAQAEPVDDAPVVDVDTAPVVTDAAPEAAVDEAAPAAEGEVAAAEEEPVQDVPAVQSQDVATMASTSTTYNIRDAIPSDGKYLTQSDMDGIIEVANQYGVQIIPTFNSPGHIGGLYSLNNSYFDKATATDYDSNCGKVTLLIENADAYEFGIKVNKLYIDYFAGKGCKSFNIAADEATLGNVKYDSSNDTFAKYVNELNIYIKSKGMTARMFNDGIKSASSSKIDKDITVLYWAPENTAASFVEEGRSVVNFSYGAGLYFAYGASWWVWNQPVKTIYDGWYPGALCRNTGDNYQDNYVVTEEIDSSKLLGASFAVWADYAIRSSSVNGMTFFTNNTNDVVDKIQVVGERCWKNSSTDSYSTWKSNLTTAPGGIDVSSHTIDGTTLPAASAFKKVSTEPKLVVDDTVESVIKPVATKDGAYNVAVKAGETLKLKVTNYEGSLTWESNNADVATVDQNGKVTFTGGKGEVTITAAPAVATYAADGSTVFTATFAVTPRIGGDLTDVPEYTEGKVAGDNSVKYVLDTGTYDSSATYLIVAASTGKALSYTTSGYSGTVKAVDVTINDDNTVTISDTTNALWTINSSGRITNGDYTLYIFGSGNSRTLSVAYSDYVYNNTTWTIGTANANNGTRTISQSIWSQGSNRTYYLRYNNSFEVTRNNSSNTVRLYKQVTGAGYTVNTTYLKNLIDYANGLDSVGFSNWDTVTAGGMTGMDDVLKAAQAALDAVENPYTTKDAAEAAQTAVNEASQYLHDALAQLAKRIGVDITVICVDEDGTVLEADKSTIMAYETADGSGIYEYSTTAPKVSGYECMQGDIIEGTVDDPTQPLTLTYTKAAFKPVDDCVEIPITIVDYRADGLLFDYSLYDASIAYQLVQISKNSNKTTAEAAIANTELVSLTPQDNASGRSTSWADGVGNGSYIRTGMVEGTLGANGMPVYTEETVKYVASKLQSGICSSEIANKASNWNNVLYDTFIADGADRSVVDTSADAFSNAFANTKSYENISNAYDLAWYLLNTLYIGDTNMTEITGTDGKKYNVPIYGMADDTYNKIFLVKDDSDNSYYMKAYTATTGAKIKYDKANKALYNSATDNTNNSRFLYPLCDEGYDKYLGDTTDIQSGESADNDYPVHPNGNYTLRGESQFVYHANAGQYFEFTGDDDVYLFINGKLVLDLGGAHWSVKKIVYMDDIADGLLTDGEVATFTFFYMERFADCSNFGIRTNLELVQRGIKVEKKGYDTSYENEIRSGSIVETGTTVAYDLTVTNKGKATMENIAFADTDVNGATVSLGYGVETAEFSPTTDASAMFKLADSGKYALFVTVKNGAKDVVVTGSEATFETLQGLSDAVAKITLKRGQTLHVRFLQVTADIKESKMANYWNDVTVTAVSANQPLSDTARHMLYSFNAEDTAKAYVVDFGLPLKIKNIFDGTAKPYIVDELVTLNDESSIKYGELVINPEKTGFDTELTYTLNDKTTIDAVERVVLNVKYQFGNTTTSLKKNIRIIPASTVYYEDDFMSFTNANSETGVLTAAGDNGFWYTDGTKPTDTVYQAMDKLGDEAANNYGYDSAYNACTKFSLGSAVKVTVDPAVKNDNTEWPYATFTFKGTGFDIISLTDNTSGAIYVDIYKGDKVDETQRLKGYVVNNYYGYTYKNDQWVIEDNVPNATYQVPVIKSSGLDYGQYTVKIMVGYSQYQDVANKGAYSFWMDAIRVYDPAGTTAIESDYAKDGEQNPDFVQLRKVLLDAGAFSVDENVSGAVFIDAVRENCTIEDYNNYGPNHEVYLTEKQAIAFQLVASAKPEGLQLGAKLANGNSATLTVGDGTTIKAEKKNKEGANTLTLTTATDMFYMLDVQWTKQDDGTYMSNVITLTNPDSSDGMISLTNLKFINAKYTDSVKAVTNAASDEVLVTMVMDADIAQAAVAAVDSVLHPQEEVKTFAPERFEASWNRSSVKAGEKATLTVKTSEDVEAITVDGVTIDTYRTRTQRTGWGWNAKKVTYREFTYTITASETADHEIVAVNAEGTASEAITATLTVRAAAQRPGIGGWLNKLFSRWF